MLKTNKKYTGKFFLSFKKIFLIFFSHLKKFLKLWLKKNFSIKKCPISAVRHLEPQQCRDASKKPCRTPPFRLSSLRSRSQIRSQLFRCPQRWTAGIRRTDGCGHPGSTRKNLRFRAESPFRRSCSQWKYPVWDGFRE